MNRVSESERNKTTVNVQISGSNSLLRISEETEETEETEDMTHLSQLEAHWCLGQLQIHDWYTNSEGETN